MNRYTGIKCPHCNRVFNDSDLVVVCPDCGAPYHRSCVQEMEHVCEFADKHASGFTWQKYEQQNSEPNYYENPGELRCSRCGTLNESHALFCAVCGTPLQPGSFRQTSPDEQAPGQNGFPPPFGAGTPFRTMGYDPFSTPYGGLSPDEEIDGIPAKDLAIFVGENSQYYLPKFKDMKTKGKVIMNWSGFLLDFLFLIYRKMYIAAALVFLIPRILILGVAFAVTGFNPDSITMQSAAVIEMAIYGITLMALLFVGLTANRLYMNHCFKKIREIKIKTPDKDAYYAALTKSGSVSRKAILIVCGIYFVINCAVYLYLMFL